MSYKPSNHRSCLPYEREQQYVYRSLSRRQQRHTEVFIQHVLLINAKQMKSKLQLFLKTISYSD